ncbi:MAG: protein kinase, partial [bacterium]|nr:protein kinase [bacterium]
NVIHTLAWHYDPASRRACLIMPVASLTLRVLLRNQDHLLERGLALDCARQVASGLSHVHSLRILHRDLKPANILAHIEGAGTSQMRLRFVLADFGCARPREAREDMTVGLVTPWYRAPEAFEVMHRSSRQAYGAALDVWSLGCVLGELCHGCILFEAPESTTAALAAIRARLGDPRPEELAELRLPKLAAWPRPLNKRPLQDLPVLPGRLGMAVVTRACLAWSAGARATAQQCAEDLCSTWAGEQREQRRGEDDELQSVEGERRKSESIGSEDEVEAPDGTPPCEADIDAVAPSVCADGGVAPSPVAAPAAAAAVCADGGVAPSPVAAPAATAAVAGAPVEATSPSPSRAAIARAVPVRRRRWGALPPGAPAPPPWPTPAMPQ